MTETPPRRRPSVAGVRIPSKAPPAAAPLDEKAYALLREISEKFDHSEAERASERGRDLVRWEELHERVGVVEQHVAELREARLVYSEGQQRLEKKVDRYGDHILKLTQTDVDQATGLGDVKLQMANLATASGKLAGNEAGRSQGSRWGALSGVIAAIVLTAIEWAARKLGGQ